MIPFLLLPALAIFLSKKNNNMQPKNEDKISKLHPQIRDKARLLIDTAMKQGIELIITSGYRTYAEQNVLYEQGRTTPGQKVTNARGGFSNHNFALAFDVVPVVNGKLDWNSKEWQKIGKIGKSLGFKWGGDWKSIKDYPHFEMMFGNTLAQLRQKKIDNGFVIV